MLTRNITSTKEIPNEPGQQITFRQLGWKDLTNAEEVRSATVLKNLKAMGGEMLRELQNVSRPQVEEQAATEQAADPLAKYDQATILYSGIAAWTYSAKPTRDEIDSLDATTAKWATTQIIEMGAGWKDEEQQAHFLRSPTSLTESTPASQTVAVSAAMGYQPNGSSA